MSLTDRIILLWVRFVRNTQNTIIAFLRVILYRSIQDPKKVLVFRTGSIGDNICALPALVSIRRAFPKAQLDILSNAGSRNLVSLQAIYDTSQYNRIIDYLGHSPRQLLQLLRQERYDLVIELPQDQVRLMQAIRNIIFFKMANARSAFGWQVNTVFSSRQRQEVHSTFQSERDRLLNILRPFIPVVESAVFPLNITTSDQQVVAEAWKLMDPSKKKIAIVPGAKRPQNRYPIQRMIQLANWIASRNYEVVVVGGPEDATVADQMKGDGIHAFCGVLTPVQSAVLLSKCAITISNDTGPMHLSYAVGTPVVALFSSRDFPGKWFPPATAFDTKTPNVVLRNNHVHCSLCFSETCDNNICMQGIPLEAVKDAFLQIEEALR